jgi:hypothetical protein
MRDVREVMVEGPSGILMLEGRARPRWEVSRARLVWPNGAEAFGFSAEEPERLRGPQFHAAWCDEFAAWKKGDYTLKLLRMGLRLGAHPRLCVTTTPKPLAVLRKLRAEASCVVTAAATAANAANLAPHFLDVLDELYGGTSFARQELEGELLEDAGALFREQDLVAARGEDGAAPEGGRSAGGDAWGGVRDRRGGAARAQGLRAGGPQRARRLAAGMGACGRGGGAGMGRGAHRRGGQSGRGNGAHDLADGRAALPDPAGACAPREAGPRSLWPRSTSSAA